GGVGGRVRAQHHDVELREADLFLDLRLLHVVEVALGGAIVLAADAARLGAEAAVDLVGEVAHSHQERLVSHVGGLHRKPDGGVDGIFSGDVVDDESDSHAAPWISWAGSVWVAASARRWRPSSFSYQWGSRTGSC